MVLSGPANARMLATHMKLSCIPTSNNAKGLNNRMVKAEASNALPEALRRCSDKARMTKEVIMQALTVEGQGR